MRCAAVCVCGTSVPLAFAARCGPRPDTMSAGAGKSSVFRCLGGLWTIPEGQISKPGSKDGKSGLSGSVFYLPQKPYNVLGTLFDQLTYPEIPKSAEVRRARA